MNAHTKEPASGPAREFDALRVETLERELIELHRQLTAATERVETMMAFISRVPGGRSTMRGKPAAETPAPEESDLLYGVPAIAEFLGRTEKQARHRVEAGIIPTFKMPGARSVCARRSTLTAWLADLEAAR
ncbi:helix-turn-helix transcriptional regulator [Xanthobacter sediminis]